MGRYADVQICKYADVCQYRDIWSISISAHLFFSPQTAPSPQQCFATDITALEGLVYRIFDKLGKAFTQRKDEGSIKDGSRTVANYRTTERPSHQGRNAGSNK
jgi:hypothetical protein